eukprot:Protomagalhaensia_sp_Gyna_25__5106@NODE_58_length_5893_cov_92_436112_g43_i0_p1_GENE_NODE_58_length_5893_cov_92_436112_g43_i0NODE_58_length_5893_cov_92_436112_g43_i0_p1_ORF_typecomplete_len664_score93_28MFS_1/PF07690_16/3_5e14MFS_1/PF07690_16/2_4e05MFS_2/PF13347_6/1_7e06MFS_2/PF13347_6/2_9e02MFS_2/PF13347_6/0_0087MFS_3/PF05977_13/4_4e06MFS_3/PF05977_13/0_062MFS_1_like/PF12832_7/1_9e07MFS_1_like/PF12832_7/34Sugar_tr/PF00083_24/2_9e06Sugar_tr/PF00083_24/1_5e03LacY_symp/PF01306_19/6_3e05DoxX_3/PF137
MAAGSWPPTMQSVLVPPGLPPSLTATTTSSPNSSSTQGVDSAGTGGADIDPAEQNLRVQIVSQIRRLQLICFLLTLSVVLPFPVFPYFFTKRLGFSSGLYGLTVGACSLTHLAAAIGYGRASDRFGRRRVLLLQSAMGCTLYLAFCVALRVPRTALKPLAVAIYIALGAANTANLLTCSAVCDLCLGATSLARARPAFLAQVAGVLGLAAAVGPLAGQAVQQTFGGGASPIAVFAMASAASAAAGCVALYMRETNPALYKPAPSESSDSFSVECTVTDAGAPPGPPGWWVRVSGWCSRICGNKEDSSPGRSPAVELSSSCCCAKSENSFHKRAHLPLLMPASTVHPEPTIMTPVTDTQISVSPETPCKSKPDWNSLKSIYVCQLLKSLSLTSITVCYALVLDLLLPPNWLYGLKSEQIIAIGLSTTSLVRVSIQLGWFQQILNWLRGPGVAFLLGCGLMGAGQLATYWSIAELPQYLDLSEAVERRDGNRVLTYAVLHFITMGALLSAGTALVEPSLSALLALGVAEHKSYQGLAQGFYSAINQLGSTLGPPVMGWLLAMKAVDREGCALGAQNVQLNLQGGMTALSLEAASSLDLNKVIPSLPIANLWDLDSVRVDSIASLECARPSSEARPLLPFLAGAVLAMVPLVLYKRVLMLARNWER